MLTPHECSTSVFLFVAKAVKYWTLQGGETVKTMGLCIEECKTRFLQGLMEPPPLSTSSHLRANARGWLICYSNDLIYKDMVIHMLEAADGEVSQGIERAVLRRGIHFELNANRRYLVMCRSLWSRCTVCFILGQSTVLGTWCA